MIDWLIQIEKNLSCNFVNVYIYRVQCQLHVDATCKLEIESNAS